MGYFDKKKHVPFYMELYFLEKPMKKNPFLSDLIRVRKEPGNLDMERPKNSEPSDFEWSDRMLDQKLDQKLSQNSDQMSDTMANQM